MSRKTLISIAAAATVAVATLASQAADARSFGTGGFGGGGRTFGGGATGMHFTGHTVTPGVTPMVLPRGPGHPIIPIIPVGHPGHPGHPWIFPHHHGHVHWVFREGRWIVLDDVVVEEQVVAAPGPCTCLTKTYTPSGLVVFADVCTKESASAPVGSHADATEVPTSPVAATAVPMSVVPTAPNYAGRTYEDYLAANGQAVSPQAANPAAPETPRN
jgi:hypothetical protein